MSDTPVAISPLGDSAITLTFGSRVAPGIQRRVRLAAERMRTAGIDGVREVVAAYSALTVFYDPLRVAYDALASRLQQMAGTDGPDSTLPTPREFRFRVQYDGEDLRQVAERTGLDVADVIARHAAPWYEVGLVGFAPGFAYLGALDPALVLPRRAEPRPRVPAGAVAIGGAHTGVYPFATPGGWHLIGRTDAVLFDPHRAEPALLRVG
ncbi:MAG TPA: 5-oxoprolinase subunit PxpB, partial [Gemmatimonadales bacterium]|nr:5-oxoprolinase subunit PxpB [Gemmatimonadales bacterium]